MPTKRIASNLAFQKKKHYPQGELQRIGAKNKKKKSHRVTPRVNLQLTHPGGIDYVNDAGAWGDIEMGIQTSPPRESPPKVKESILAKRKLSFFSKRQGKKQKSQHEIEMEMALAISKQEAAQYQAPPNYLKLVASCFDRKVCDILSEGRCAPATLQWLLDLQQKQHAETDIETIRENADALRSKVIKWLRENKDWHNFCAPRTPQQYIQAMKKPTEFFDNIALSAARSVLNCNIHIFPSEQMVHERAQMLSRMIKLDIEMPKATLVLGQIGQIHFVGMPLIDDYNAALGTDGQDEAPVLSSIEVQDKAVSSTGITQCPK